MAQITRVRPGVQTAQDGTYAETRGTRKAALGTQDVGGRYEEASFRQLAYIGVNSGPQALSSSAVSATTYTGLLLANPTGSGKNLSLLEITVALTNAPVTVPVNNGFSIMLGYSAYVAGLTSTNALGPLPALLSAGNLSVARVASSCTLTSGPVLCRALASLQTTGTATSAIAPLFVKDDVSGAIVVPPGQMIMLVATPTPGVTFTTSPNILGSFTWEEISLN